MTPLGITLNIGLFCALLAICCLSCTFIRTFREQDFRWQALDTIGALCAIVALIIIGNDIRATLT